jgi:CheY-like chemotaxis protein
MESRRCAGCHVSSALSPSSLAQRPREQEPWFCPSCAQPSKELGAGSAKSVSRGPLPSVRAGRRNHLRVLLVDDQDMVRRSTARSLAGFELVTASSGAEALAILSEDLDFDAVLSDVMMPRMTGPELFERCCAEYPQLAQRFVFASGDLDSARPQLQRAIERAGIDFTPCLLAKPSTRAELQLALFAAAAQAAPRSGTWSIAEPVLEVKKYRG